MREAYVHLISRLETEAGAWGRAQRLRRYLRAARTATGSGARIDALLQGESVDLLALGEEFANQLDPLHPSERTLPLFDNTDPYGGGFGYQSDEAKLHTLAPRVLGGDWRNARKLISQTQDPDELPDEELDGL